MSSIHDCDLIEEDLLLWQMLDPMIMAVSFSLHWVVQMNLITSTQSLERSATQSSLSLSLLEVYVSLLLRVLVVLFLFDMHEIILLHSELPAFCLCLLEMFLWIVAIIIYSVTVFLLERSGVLPFKSSLTGNTITALLV